jgi:hypothetical protein
MAVGVQHHREIKMSGGYIGESLSPMIYEMSQCEKSLFFEV